MEFSAIFHDVNKRYCYALDKNTFLIRVQTKKDDMRKVILHYQDKHIPRDYMDTHQAVMMEKAASDQYLDYYEAAIKMDAMCIRYYFELEDCKGEKIYYSNYEFVKEPFTDVERMYDCPELLREQEQFIVPRWAKNKVIYQIFPSRYATDKNVPSREWYKEPISFKDDLQGNLRGIIDHLDHLEELGVDVIYMTPIFQSPSCHKYDTVDYYHIDPSFGTEEDLRELVDKAHKMGMRVILDAVFNHTSPEFFAFKDVAEKEWDSKYIDWYYISEFPLRRSRGEKPNYKCFGYYGGMPKLNLENPQTSRYFIDVALYWLKEFHIDGWRLDVADEISHRFWKNFRREVKAVNPEALIIGEIWHYAGDFLEGDEWDSVMNYPFYNAVKDYVVYGTLNTSQFMGNLDFIRGRSHIDAHQVLVNLIGSHDTPRFLHLCGSKEKQKLAAAMLLLMPGMPMIYYGDEYGMQGGQDPDNRRGMYWDQEHQDQDMFSWYKKLIQVRKAHPVITEGKTIVRITDDESGLIVLVKELAGERITLIFHNGTEEVRLQEWLKKAVATEDMVQECAIMLANELKDTKNLLTDTLFDGAINGYEVLVLTEI